MTFRSARWFFLVGLLILTAILAVPNVLGQRAKRRQSISAANLRQWGIAFNLYLGDSQNALPLPGAAETLTTQENAWFNALPPYLGLPMLKDLPVGQRPAPGQQSLWVNPAAQSTGRIPPDQFFFTYGMNARLVPPTDASVLKIYDLDPPSSIVFLAEVEGFHPTSTPQTVVRRFGNNPPNDPKSSAHVLFCDGHVELVAQPRFEAMPGTPNAVLWFPQLKDNLPTLSPSASGSESGSPLPSPP
jgi:prepilin-type processing-associated H-X9-DG protein